MYFSLVGMSSFEQKNSEMNRIEHRILMDSNENARPVMTQ
jgi:hypothetical protein